MVIPCWFVRCIVDLALAASGFGGCRSRIGELCKQQRRYLWESGAARANIIDLSARALARKHWREWGARDETEAREAPLQTLAASEPGRTASELQGAVGVHFVSVREANARFLFCVQLTTPLHNNNVFF